MGLRAPAINSLVTVTVQPFASVGYETTCNTVVSSREAAQRIERTAQAVGKPSATIQPRRGGRNGQRMRPAPPRETPLSPLWGSPEPGFDPRLAPWALFLRRLAAGNDAVRDSWGRGLANPALSVFSFTPTFSRYNPSHQKSLDHEDTSQNHPAPSRLRTASL